MNKVTQILTRIEDGDGTATEECLPLVYDQPGRLTAQKLAHEKAGQTPQSTSLAHEAYLRLFDVQRGTARGRFQEDNCLSAIHAGLDDFQRDHSSHELVPRSEGVKCERLLAILCCRKAVSLRWAKLVAFKPFTQKRQPFSFRVVRDVG